MSNGTKEVEVVDVVANEADVAESDAQFLADSFGGFFFGERSQPLSFGRSGMTTEAERFAHLAAYALIEVVQLEFAGTCFDDRRGLGGEDATGYACLTEEHHAHAIDYAEAFHLFAIGRIIHAAIGQTTVDVGKEKSYVVHFVHVFFL